MYRQVVGIGQQDALLIADEPSADYCEVQPGMCLTADAKAFLDSLDCAVPVVRGYSTLRGRGGVRGLRGFGSGLGKICSIYGRPVKTLTRDRLQDMEFDLCAVKRANLPLCSPPPPSPPAPPPPVRTFEEPDPTPPEVEPEDDTSTYMIGGLLAALVVGGVGYAVFKNRKKGKKKKRR